MNRAFRKRVQRLLEKPLPASSPAEEIFNWQFRHSLELLLPLTPEAAPSVAVQLAQSLMDTTEKAGPEAARLFPSTQVAECRAGCSSCCHEPLQVSPLDAISVAHFLQGSQLDYLLPTRDGRELKKIFMPCPMLGADGRCQVYAARPVVCRAYHSTRVSRCQANLAQRDERRDVPMNLHQFGYVGLPQEGALAALAELGIDRRPVVLGLAVRQLLQTFEAWTTSWLAGEPTFEPVVVLEPRVRKL